jgi:hypothetical protein
MFFGKNNKTLQDYKNKESNLIYSFKKSVDKASDGASKCIKSATDNFSQMREKSKNLLQTNLDLGLKHLNAGNISEAHFRFFIVTKLWPKCEDGLYYYANTLFLKQNYAKASFVIAKIFQLNSQPNQQVIDLQAKIKSYLNS